MNKGTQLGGYSIPTRIGKLLSFSLRQNKKSFTKKWKWIGVWTVLSLCLPSLGFPASEDIGRQTGSVKLMNPESNPTLEAISPEEGKRFDEVFDSYEEFHERFQEADIGISSQKPSLGLKPQIKKELAFKNYKELLTITGKSWWESWMEDGGGTPFDWATQCSNAPGITQSGEVLDCWLNLHPQVANNLVWEEVDPNTGAFSAPAYPNWPASRKAELHEAFYHAYNWLKDGMGYYYGANPVDPPYNLLSLGDEEYPCNRITRNGARQFFMASVGHSLALEIGGFIPWSVTGYGQTDMQTLFHSKYFYKAGVQSCGDHDFNGYSVRGRVIPSKPITIFEHLVDKNIIGPDHFSTLTRMLEWSRNNLSHFFGKYTTKNAEYYWNYRGGVPAKRVFEGTHSQSPEVPNSLQGLNNWTAGCRGTSEFYRSVLRMANIPVQVFKEGCDGHTIPIFWTVQRALTHGDDPYSSFTKGLDGHSHPYSASELMVPIFTFKFWFTSPEAECSNVGRQVAQLTIQHLPDQLLKYYCMDVNNGLNHADGKVYEYLGRFFSLSYLEGSQNLWPRMAVKASSQGYCDTLNFDVADPDLWKIVSKIP